MTHPATGAPVELGELLTEAAQNAAADQATDDTTPDGYPEAEGGEGS